MEAGKGKNIQCIRFPWPSTEILHHFASEKAKSHGKDVEAVIKYVMFSFSSSQSHTRQKVGFSVREKSVCKTLAIHENSCYEVRGGKPSLSYLPYHSNTLEEVLLMAQWINKRASLPGASLFQQVTANYNDCVPKKKANTFQRSLLPTVSQGIYFSLTPAVLQISTPSLALFASSPFRSTSHRQTRLLFFVLFSYPLKAKLNKKKN